MEATDIRRYASAGDRIELRLANGDALVGRLESVRNGLVEIETDDRVLTVIQTATVVGISRVRSDADGASPRMKGSTAGKTVAKTIVRRIPRGQQSAGSASPTEGRTPSRAVHGRAADKPATGPADPYAHAKKLDEAKDLEGAKAAYRAAIKAGVRPQSAVKDLTVLTKRTEGAAAALKVIEVEFPGLVREGDARDNLMVDLYVADRRYDDALRVLNRQLANKNKNLTATKRKHLHRQIAYVKLSGRGDRHRGQDGSDSCGSGSDRQRDQFEERAVPQSSCLPHVGRLRL